MTTENVEIKITKTGDAEAAQGLDRVAAAAENVGKKVDVAGGAIGYLNKLLAQAGAAFAVERLISYGEHYDKLVSKIRSVSDSNTQLAETEQKLFDIANRSRQSFEDTASMYVGLAKATQGQKISQEDLLKTTELIDKAMTASGKSAEDMSGAMKMFTFSLAQGQLEGRGLHTVLLQFPGLGKAIASGMGVSVGALKGLAEQGKLTAANVVEALIKSEGQIDKAWKNAPVTIGQAFTVLGNYVMRFVGQINNTNGITGSFAQGLMALGPHIDTIGKAILVAATGFAAYRAAAALISIQNTIMASSFVASAVAAHTAAGATGILGTALTVLRGIVTGLWVTLAANPFTAIITIMAVVVAAVVAWGTSGS